MGGQTMVQERPNDRSSHIFSVPPEKAELGLGSRHHLLYSAPRESGAEKEKKVYVSKPRFHHWLRRQRRTIEVNQERRRCGGVFRRHQIVLEERQRRLCLQDRVASLRGLGVALPVRGQDKSRVSCVTANTRKNTARRKRRHPSSTGLPRFTSTASSNSTAPRSRTSLLPRSIPPNFPPTSPPHRGHPLGLSRPGLRPSSGSSCGAPSVATSGRLDRGCSPNGWQA